MPMSIMLGISGVYSYQGSSTAPQAHTHHTALCQLLGAMFAALRTKAPGLGTHEAVQRVQYSKNLRQKFMRLTDSYRLDLKCCKYDFHPIQMRSSFRAVYYIPKAPELNENFFHIILQGVFFNWASPEFA